MTPIHEYNEDSTTTHGSTRYGKSGRLTRSLMTVASAVAFASCGDGVGEGFDYPEFSDEADRTAQTIIDNCGDVDADACRDGQLQFARESLSSKDYADVCHALVYKVGEDPARCP